MANKPNQKLKLLHVLKALMEKTDDVNGLTTYDIIGELARHGIEAERKGIYRDIDALREFGLDIRQRGGKEWYLASRPFDLQEMILLVDALQSTPFLTDDLTDHLIERVRAFASDDQRKMLQRRIEVPGRIKMENQEIFQNLDIIQQAMRLKRKVEFQYFQYDLKKKRVARKEGAAYTATPVRLVYADERYYLVTFNDYWADHGGNAFTPYRVDRMMNVRLSEEPATKDPRIANYHTEEHISPSFGVYASDKVVVMLEADEDAMNQVIDRFGVDALVFSKNDDRVQVRVKAPLSPQFYGWLLMLAPHVKIAYPKRAVEEFAAMLERTQKMYQGSYRICSNTARRVVTQEQFLELVERLDAELTAYVADELGGKGFQSQNDFDEVAWRIIEDWRIEREVKDGMPYGPLEYRTLVKGKNAGKTVLAPQPVWFDGYTSFGQVVGEAIIVVNPRRFAAAGCEAAFTDTEARFNAASGDSFLFDALPTNGSWDKISGEDMTGKRHSLDKGACYEIRYEKREGKRCTRMLFCAPELGIPELELEPWNGTTKNAGDMKAIMKHWQMIAYRFA